MKIELKISEIVNIIDAELIKGDYDDVVGNIATDTRERKWALQRSVNRNSVFIALKGENFDGHRFVDNAIKKGVKGVIVDRDVDINSNSVSVLRVENTTKALMNLAKYVRGLSKAKFIGITGTSGKTTTKDILSGILQSKFEIYKTFHTTNNEFGVPLNILNIEGDEDFVIIEVGTNKPGEIEMHAKILQPDIAIATNVDIGHIEFFRNIEHIAEEKETLFKYLPEDGYAILNADDRYVKNFNTDANKFFYAIDNDADLIVDNWEDLYERGLKFTVEGVDFETFICGKHNLSNIMASLSCAKIVGMSISDCVKPVSSIIPTKSRMEVINTGKTLIVNDAYNANPLSMKKSLEWFFSIPHLKKRILVLGDMLELGEDTENSHREMGVFVGNNVDNGLIERVYYIGEYSDYFYDGYKESTELSDRFFELENGDKERVLKEIKKQLGKDTGVLFKASNSIGLSKLAEKLINQFKKTRGE